jgi:lipopolysaccharide export LptBFGC system permease protein LptF
MVDIVVAHSSGMTPTTLARVAGVLGGLCWLARAILDDGDGPTSLIDALHWGGTALLAIALLGIGADLVTGLVALRVVVAICLVLLAWAVLEFLHSQYADRGVDGILGVLMALYCVAGLVYRHRHPGDGVPRKPRRPSGSHVA